MKYATPPPEFANKTFRESDWRCPCGKLSRLRPVAGGFTCATPKCYHGTPKNKFGLAGGIPILLSPHLCDSVCDPKKVTPYVATSAKGFQRFTRVLVGESKTTKRNCQAFIQQVKAVAKTSKTKTKAKVLVIGAGLQGDGTQALWADEAIIKHGIDIYASPSVDAVADAHYLPLPSGAYHGVWIQAVLEHVVEPTRVVAEIHRVLRPGGVVYAETPFMQQVHAGAYDFTRFTVLGHRYLFRHFALLDMGGTKGAEVALAWALRYFVWAVTRSRRLFMLAGGFAVLLRPFGFLVSKRSLYDSPSGVYFLGSKSDKLEVTHKQLIKLYRGQYKGQY